LAGLLLVYCAAVVVKLSWHTNAGQWDLNAYYFAGKALAIGADPYDPRAAPTALSGWRVDFRYPPATLPVFYLLGRLDYPIAYYVFLYVKVAVLAGVIWLWRWEFVGDEADMLFYLICLLGFNGSLYTDVVAGNISVFEHAGIWLAFAALLRGRLAAFCTLIVLTASFKVQPILFLGLLWLLPGHGRARTVYFVAAITAFAVIQAAPSVIKPSLFAGFCAQAVGLTETGPGNPCAWAVVTDLFDSLERDHALCAPVGSRYLTYGMWVVAIICVSLRAVWPLRERGDGRAIIYIYCFVFALIVPRFKDYSYGLLLVPAFWAIKRWPSAPAYPLLALALVFAPMEVKLPGLDVVMAGLVRPYYSFVLACVLWVLALASVGQRDKADLPT